MREFTQSLCTQNYKVAIPAAYKLASEAKTLFNYFDSLMDEKEPNKEFDIDLLRQIVETLEKEEPKPKNPKKSVLSLSALMALKKKDIAMDVQKERHENELEQALKQRELVILKITSLTHCLVLKCTFNS
ncbi:MAG: hypothetical protein PHR16_00240 [Methylovulum sp.]|nr:hypothetical protein [Methylovulum sp.]